MAVGLGYGVQSSHYYINVLYIAVIIKEILQTVGPICQVPVGEGVRRALWQLALAMVFKALITILMYFTLQ